MEYTIGIIGIGFVGGAIKKFFETNETYVKIKRVIGYDKYKEPYNTIEQLYELIERSDIIYMCLPTPFDSERCYNTEEMECTIRIINEVLLKIPIDERTSKCIVSKSTMTPTMFNTILSNVYVDKQTITDLKIGYIHNPEFLSARTAYIDFCQQSHVVIGKTECCSSSIFQMFEQFNRNVFPNANISTCDSNTSETMKILVNTFYASKIMIMNEYYMMCKQLGINYDDVIDLMLKNGWINPMHTLVPGTDGKLGFGGTCFTKDTYALHTFMKQHNMMSGILENVIEECKKLR